MLQNFDPYFFWSNIVLLIISFVSNYVAIRDAVSWGKSNLSHILQKSSLIMYSSVSQ